MGNRKDDPKVRLAEDKLKKVFIQRLRHARRNACLSQAELAKRIDASSSAVNAWMNGRWLPDAVYLPALSRELRVSIDWLFGLGEVNYYD